MNLSFIAVWLALVSVFAAGCGDNARPFPGEPRLSRRFISDQYEGCLFASPKLVTSRGADQILVASGDGRVSALDPDSGALVWEVVLDAPEGQQAHIAATPGVAGDKVVLAWQDVRPDLARTAHHVAVVDLEGRALDADFPAVTLAASGQSVEGDSVPFAPANAYSRSAIAVARPTASTHGVAYVSFGNIRDIQPWHGWVFELDLDAWRSGGAAAAVTGVLLTTPEIECGVPGDSGADDMICGGGVWAPPGPLVVPAPEGGDDYRLIVPTGNGQLDLARDDYANTLMRTGRGLAFDPGCDPGLCADFDPIDPATACVESCVDLFIPRLLPGQPMLDPPGGWCEGKTFFECYAILDYDLGANVPARIELDDGPTVLVLPAKDGGVYLMDDARMGRLYDRLQLMPVCGSGGGSCSANWAGMMVTQPVVTSIEGKPAVLIATFEHDTNHPAGLVALAIVMGEDGLPRLERLWEAPDFDQPEALERFRRHNGRVGLVSWEGQDYALLVDVARGGSSGILLLVRVSDGAIIDRGTLAGPGQRFVEPLVAGTSVTLTSCASNEGPGHIEGWEIVAPD